MRRWAALAALMAVLVVGSACGGGDDSTEAGSTASTSAPAGDIRLERFRYRAVLRVLAGGAPVVEAAQEGRAVLPDREAHVLTLTMDGETVTSDVVTVGDRRWYRGVEPGIDLGLGPLLDGEASDGSFLTDLRGVLSDHDGVEETLESGRPARRYEIPESELARVLEGSPFRADGDATVTVWLDPELDLPVGITATLENDAGSLEIDIQVFDVNDEEVTVDAP